MPLHYLGPLPEFLTSKDVICLGYDISLPRAIKEVRMEMIEQIDQRGEFIRWLACRASLSKSGAFKGGTVARTRKMGDLHRK